MSDESQRDLEAFHGVLFDIAHGICSQRVREFLVQAYVRGARCTTAEENPLEGSTAVFTKRRYRDKWNRSIVKHVGTTHSHHLRVKTRVRVKQGRRRSWRTRIQFCDDSARGRRGRRDEPRHGKKDREVRDGMVNGAFNSCGGSAGPKCCDDLGGSLAALGIATSMCSGFSRAWFQDVCVAAAISCVKGVRQGGSCTRLGISTTHMKRSRCRTPRAST